MLHTTNSISAHEVTKNKNKTLKKKKKERKKEQTRDICVCKQTLVHRRIFYDERDCFCRC